MIISIGACQYACAPHEREGVRHRPLLRQQAAKGVVLISVLDRARRISQFLNVADGVKVVMRNAPIGANPTGKSQTMIVASDQQTCSVILRDQIYETNRIVQSIGRLPVVCDGNAIAGGVVSVLP